MSSSPITPEMRAQFERDGYLAVDGLLSDADLQPVVDDYAATLDALAWQWQAEGQLTEAHASLPFGKRLVRIIGESGVNWTQHFDISLPQSQVQPDTPIHTTEAVFDLLTHPHLLDAAEAFVGPEITSNPIQHTRIKPPERMVPKASINGLNARVGWHQDQGVATPEQDEVPVLTVWLAITDATERNGCLCVVPESHRGGLTTHCPGTGPDGGLQIPPKLIAREAVPVPLRAGGALFLHRRTIHAALENVSDDIRWSFDLRYQPSGLPTGRPAFPEFVARSRAHPGTELRDWRAWASLWEDTRARLAAHPIPKFNRWTADAVACA